MNIKFMLMGCFVYLGICSVCQEPQKNITTLTPQSVAKQIDQHYNMLNSMTAEFTQTERGMGVDRVERGKINLKRKGRMRWDYFSPIVKSFILDGKDAWLYLPEERQARHSKVKQLDDLRSPLRFLLGHAQLTKELDSLTFEQPEDKTHFVISGVPKHELGGNVGHLWIEVTPKMEIIRLWMEASGGVRTEFRFTNIQEDVPLQDSLFRFTAPKGVEVIEEHLMEQMERNSSNPR
jgi:outer membrane lipoprotein carrier protein